MSQAAEGAKIVCADLTPEARTDVVIDQEQGKPTHAEIGKNGGEAIFVEADVTSAKSVEKLVEDAVQKFGRLDM